MSRLSISSGRGSISRVHDAPPLSELQRMKASMDDDLDLTSSNDDLEITHVVRRELRTDTRFKSELFGLLWSSCILS